MTKCTQSKDESQLSIGQQNFLSNPTQGFRELLPPHWFDRLESEASNYRERVFTPQVTLQAFLEQSLSEDGSCKQAVARVLAGRVEQRLPANSMNTGPYCKARYRLPLGLLNEAVLLSGQALESRVPEQWTWQGYRVKVVDGSTVQMADTEANQAEFPQVNAQAPGLGFPIARLVSVFSLASGAVIDYALGAYSGKGSGEMSLFSHCLQSLSPGDLLLGYCYYCTYEIIALMEQLGIPVLFKLHAQRHVDFRRGQALGKADHVVSWQLPASVPKWLSKEQYQRLPRTLTVREFRCNGQSYVTTLFDARTHSKKVLVELYEKRWSAELDLRTLKTHLGMEKLRCQSPEMVKKEIAVYFLAYNFIRATIAQAAYAHQRCPREVSFKATVQLLTSFRSLLAKNSREVIDVLHRAIASTLIGQRKRPPQPRAVKRRPKQYRKLMQPRHIACQNLINARA